MTATPHTSAVPWHRAAVAWLVSHPIQGFTALVAIYSLVRLLGVSRLHPPTMAALLQTSTLAVIGTGLAAALQTVAIGLYAVVLVRYLRNGLKRDDTPSWPYWGLGGLATLSWVLAIVLLPLEWGPTALLGLLATIAGLTWLLTERTRIPTLLVALVALVFVWGQQCR